MGRIRIRIIEILAAFYDAIRKAFSVKKVTSSHGKGETVILTESDIDEAALRSTIGATGYEVKAVSKEPYEKKGLFHR